MDEAPRETTLSDAAVAQDDDLIRFRLLLRVRHFGARQDELYFQLGRTSALRLMTIIPPDTGNDV